ncbi:MAG: signal peptidase I [Clostridium celatum]|nr:signal peptidase I [Clostridium celatum]
MIEVVKKKKFFMKVFYDWIIPIICAVFIAILINKFLIFQIQIPSESMLPTLEIGDRLFANRIYKEESLSRGDLIIFYSDEKKELMIKRLIGLPNDNVVIDNGVLSVNGEILTEDYIQNQDYFSGSYTVPAGKYFFLGDNRGDSFDSRYWVNKYIDFNDIKGKAFIRVFPFDEFGFIN